VKEDTGADGIVILMFDGLLLWLSLVQAEELLLVLDEASLADIEQLGLLVGFGSGCGSTLLVLLPTLDVRDRLAEAGSEGLLKEVDASAPGSFSLKLIRVPVDIGLIRAGDRFLRKSR